MAKWKSVLGVTRDAVRVLVITTDGDDILKAHLPVYPEHPRALLTVLEGLALWHGAPLCAVISADVPVNHSLRIRHLHHSLATGKQLLTHLYCQSIVQP